MTSVMNTALSRILFGKLTHTSSNYPVYSGRIEVCIKSGKFTYLDDFGIEDFVYAFNYDRDNFVIVNPYLKLIYQKGVKFKVNDLEYAKRLVGKATNLLISNRIILSIQSDNNGENCLKYESPDSSFFINLQHKENLIKKFRGVSWWTYDIVIAIKDNKIYILIVNQ